MRIGLVRFTGGLPEPAPLDPGTVPLAECLAGAGHEVALITRDRGPEAPATKGVGVDVRELAAGPARPLTEAAVLEHVGDFVRALSQEILSGGYDLIHSHGWLTGLATQLAAPATGSVPVVHTFHRSHLIDDRGERGSRHRVTVERNCAARADHLIATTNFERDALIRAGAARARTTVIPVGVHVDPGYTGMPEQRRSAPRMVGFGPASRLAPLVRLLARLPAVELIVCGTDDHAVAADAGPLTRLAEELGVSRRLRLVETPTAEARAPLIRGANLVVCQSPSVLAGTEHLEAMALAVPVVAGNAVAAEAVVDDVTGLHAVDATPAELARLVHGLLTSPTTCQQMAVAGRDRAATRYDWRRIAEETVRVYQALLPRDREPIST